VKINRSSLYSLLPRLIASKLSLSLYFGNSVKVKVANHTVVTNQYYQFTIKVANIEIIINTYIVPKLSSFLLG
jgi:hypothetical protein